MAFVNNNYQPSGNVFVVSGNAWAGTGSVYTTGSVNVAGNPSIVGSVTVISQPAWTGLGSIYGIGIGSVYAQVAGSAVVTNTVTTQPLIGSIYGIGIGSVYVQVGAPATIGSLATQGVIGSVAVTNTVAVNSFIVSGNNWTGVGSAYIAAGSININGTVAVNSNGQNIATETTLAKLTLSQGNNVVGQNGTLIMGAVGSVAPAYTHSNSNPLSMNLAGQMRVEAVISGVNNIQVQGLAGAGVAVTGSPLNIGFRAATAYPTAVTDGQTVWGMADKAGRQSVVLNAPRDLITQPGSDAVLTASGTLVLLLQSGGTGVFNDIISLNITNGGSGATRVDILTSGTIYRSFQIAANGGGVFNFTTPMTQPQANSAWQATLDTAVNRDVRVWIQAVKNQ